MKIITRRIFMRYTEITRLVIPLRGKPSRVSFRRKQDKLVQAWIEIHKDDLLANWKLASEGEQIFKIEPLK